MGKIAYDDTSFLFDEDGFFRDPGRWDEGLARQIAALDGVGELGECQWEIIRQLREAYGRTGAPPALSHVCQVSGLAPNCMTVYFPTAREAWRIAGLPNPGEEGKAYL